MQRGLDELGLVEELAGVSGRVQLGELQRRAVRHVLLEHAQRQHRQRRVEQVVHRDEHLVEHRLQRGTRLSTVPHVVLTVYHIRFDYIVYFELSIKTDLFFLILR